MSHMEEDLLAGHPVLRTIRTLGRTGNRIVVLARNVSTGQLVAVKLVPRGFDSAQAKYLLRELLNHYELTLAKHPHIVGLLDCFLTPQYLAIVMEYVDGENLQVFLEKAGGCIIEALARFLFQQLVIALDFCHRRGKVNRNIRPSSLLLQLSDSALPLLRMVDFSASKDTLRNSEPRSQVGTAMYCAPEILQNFRGAPYDAAAADVWSVGVVLFVMLFGRHPFSRPEDAQLSAQQQVIAMFKRLTSPPGSLEGDLFVPHVLPTSSLPGAQPGAPLSLAGADLLRGMLARDPRVRLTLDAVQRHEWFQTNLPEGAALLNEVVAAEEAAAGAAAVMPASVAAALERMVIQAAAGPADGPGAPMKEVPGGGGGGGGPGEGGAGGAGAGGRGGGGPAGGGGGMRPVRDSSGGGAIMYAPTTPQSASQGPPPQQHPLPQPPAAHATPMLNGSTDYVQQTVSIGTTVPAGSPPGPFLNGSPATGDSGPRGTAEPGGVRGPMSVFAEPHWNATLGDVPGGAAEGQGAGAQTDSAMLTDWENMVLGMPDEDLVAAASLDLFCPTPRPAHNQQPPPPLQQMQLQHSHLQYNPQQQQQQQPMPPHSLDGTHAHSNTSSAVDPGAPVSTDTVGYGTPSPPQQPTPIHLGAAAAAPPPLPMALSPVLPGAGLPPPPHIKTSAPATVAFPVPAILQPESDAAAAVPSCRISDACAVALQPCAHLGGGALQDGMTTGSPAAAAALLDTTPHHPATATAATAAAAAGNGNVPLNHFHNPPLYVSLHSAAAAAPGDDDPDARAAGAGAGGGMLLRLRTDSLPSPSTLAVVDAQPFIAHGSGSAGAGGAGGSGLFGGLFTGGSYLHNLRETSMATIPSTYSMDWCTLSARSETLLSPKTAAAAATGVTGDAAAAAAGSSLSQSSLWHRICNEARDLGRAAVTGLGVRRP